jgi:DMSO/TMAO reductase YedYZ molybdopterin-dependent catalytic subunit
MKPARLDPAGPFKRDPLEPHRMRRRFTPAKDLFALCHLGVPRVEREEWSLAIDGMVEHPRILRYADLLRYPKVEVATVHQCCGSPLAPFEPTRRVSNVVWGGARLADVLADCRPLAAARYVLSSGADYGSFGGEPVDAYAKDLRLDRVQDGVLIAYELNRAPLQAENGYPVRLAVPGYYGTSSVKWLARMTLAESRGTGPFTTRWYNDPVRDDAGRDTGETTPVWSIAPESVIVSPAPNATVERRMGCEIWGWAWSDGGIRNVRVQTGDAAWQHARIEPARGRQWQRFSLWWMPEEAGAVTVSSRTEAVDGTVQPISGRRNAIHSVPVNVA